MLVQIRNYCACSTEINSSGRIAVLRKTLGEIALKLFATNISQIISYATPDCRDLNELLLPCVLYL